MACILRPFLYVAVAMGAMACAPPVHHHRVVVVAAHAPEAPEPIAGATVRVECPDGVTLPDPHEATADARGGAFLRVGIPSACFVAVSSSGYIPRRFRVADVCLEHHEEPFVCTAGVVFAPLTLEGRWNDTDASSTAAAVYNECFAAPSWAGDSAPSLRLGRTINKTDEHINLKTIANEILAAVVASPVRVLAATPGDEPPPADYHLMLEITSIISHSEGFVDRTYNVTARVMRVADTEIVCQATTKRSKREVRSTSSW